MKMRTGKFRFLLLKFYYCTRKGHKKEADVIKQVTAGFESNFRWRQPSLPRAGAIACRRWRKHGPIRGMTPSVDGQSTTLQALAPRASDGCPLAHSSQSETLGRLAARRAQKVPRLGNPQLQGVQYLKPSAERSDGLRGTSDRDALPEVSLAVPAQLQIWCMASS